MGTKTAPCFANTNMGKFVGDFVYGYPLQPILLFSYTLPSLLSWWPPSTREMTAPDELSTRTGLYWAGVTERSLSSTEDFWQLTKDLRTCKTPWSEQLSDWRHHPSGPLSTFFHFPPPEEKVHLFQMHLLSTSEIYLYLREHFCQVHLQVQHQLLKL